MQDHHINMQAHKKLKSINAFLLLGTNLGDRALNLSLVKKNIMDKSIGNIINQSSVYETAAWGIKDQPSFYNQTIEINTDLDPLELLRACLSIENEIGRKRIQKWGPRLIDIDILYYGDLCMDTKELHIPHPEIQNRRFTLVPLAEVAPDFIHPKFKKSNMDLLLECKDNLQANIVDVK